MGIWAKLLLFNLFFVTFKFFFCGYSINLLKMGGHKSKPIYSVEVKNTENEEFSNVFKSPVDLPPVTHPTLYSLIK